MSVPGKVVMSATNTRFALVALQAAISTFFLMVRDVNMMARQSQYTIELS